MRTLKALCFMPVITVLATLGLPLVAQDSDRMRETVKRLETALAQIEARLQTMHGTEGAAQGSALEQVQREQAALRAQLVARDDEIAKLRANLDAQVTTAQLADDRARQLATLNAELKATSNRAAQQEVQLAQARDDVKRTVASLTAAETQLGALAEDRNALTTALRERDQRLAQQTEETARAAAVALEREQQTAALSREIEALRGQLAETQATAEAQRREAAARLQTALDDLDTALHRPPSATEPETTNVKTEAGSVQVHHHGPGDIILNFHGAPPPTSVPPKPRIEI